VVQLLLLSQGHARRPLVILGDSAASTEGSPWANTTALGRKTPRRPPPVGVQREGVREHELAPGLGAGAAPGADV
jgi:hypothetical protein